MERKKMCERVQSSVISLQGSDSLASRERRSLAYFFHQDFIPLRYFLKTRGSVSYTKTQMVHSRCFRHLKLRHTGRQEGGRFQGDACTFNITCRIMRH